MYSYLNSWNSRSSHMWNTSRNSKFNISTHAGLSLSNRNVPVGNLQYCCCFKQLGSQKISKNMTKHQWKKAKKSFRSHLDPDVEEQLKWAKTEIESNVKKSIKLIKNINSNREGNLKKKAEVAQIIQDIQKEYQSLYDFYHNLQNEVKKKINGPDEGSSSSSSSDSDSYYTPEELNSKNIESGKQEGSKEIENNQEQEDSDSEKSVLKDILTSTSEVKKSLSFDSLSSAGEVSEFEENVKDLKLQNEQSKTRIEQLLNECANLKGKLVEKDGEILGLNNNYEDFRNQNSKEIRDFESQIKGLKHEQESIMVEKIAFEEGNLGLQIRISELETLLNQLEQENLISSSKLDGLIGKIKNLEIEVDSVSRKKFELEEQLAHETEEKSHFKTQINTLQQELELINSKNNQLELNLEKKTEEIQELVNQIEILKEKFHSQASPDNAYTKEKEDLVMKVKDLEQEVTSLSKTKIELQDHVIQTKTEADRRTSELERNLKEKENEVSIMKTQFRAKEDENSKITALNVSLKKIQRELENVQKEKKGLQLQLETDNKSVQKEKNGLQLQLETDKQMLSELTNKIADQQKSLNESENIIKKLNEEIKQVKTKLVDSSKSYQLAERKVEEMAEEFFKKFEDNLRILSRRIQVSEQLHNENKEFYKKAKEKYEIQNKDLKEKMSINEVGLKNMKEMSLTAYEILSSVDSDALRFEECTVNFLNRMSKVSCELKFAKDWIMRKNKTMLHAKVELDCLLVQLDDKEAEILVFRERVWKSENKIRELEKIIKHKEDSMLVLQEEKREAIRQLCVWIDYHRSRSDYYKKMLSDITARYKRAP